MTVLGRWQAVVLLSRWWRGWVNGAVCMLVMVAVAGIRLDQSGRPWVVGPLLVRAGRDHHRASRPRCAMHSDIAGCSPAWSKGISSANVIYDEAGQGDGLGMPGMGWR